MSETQDRHERLPGKAAAQLSAPGLLLLHGACLLLVVFYVNMFQFWAWLTRLLGPGLLVKVLPVAVTVLALLFIGQRFVDRVNRGYTVNLVFLGLGLVCAIFALAIPDPHLPIKRIHVAEYLILAFLVRATLSHRLQGGGLTLFTALVTLLLGIHDEMLQGLHPNRYYGLRDIVVNGTAGLGGALLGHGLRCFVRPGVGAVPIIWKEDFTRLLLPYLLLGGSTAWLAVSLYPHQGHSSVLPALLVQAGVCLLIMFLQPKVVFSSRTRHGFQALFWLAFGLLFYPLASQLAGLEFL